MVKDLISSNGTKKTTSDLGLQENYFAPSKYNLVRFQGKAVGHLDMLEEYFGVDFLGGNDSALAREVAKAEAEGILSQHDRKAIRSVLRSASEHVSLRGDAAVAKLENRSRKQ